MSDSFAEEIAGNTFAIAGGQPGMKVSWLETGIRQDRFANANRIPVEEDKQGIELGTYLHCKAYGSAVICLLQRRRPWNGRKKPNGV